MMKSDALPTRYTEEGLQFNDGTVIPADVIVWATGFEVNMRDSIRRLFGDEVADEIDGVNVFLSHYKKVNDSVRRACFLYPQIFPDMGVFAGHIPTRTDQSRT